MVMAASTGATVFPAVAVQTRTSELQRRVGRALAAVYPDVAFDEEHIEPRTGYSIDLALPSSRLAVEVDGPSHYMRPDADPTYTPNGSTRLKRRLLELAGWRVVSVPFFEWNVAGGDASREASYIAQAVIL